MLPQKRDSRDLAAIADLIAHCRDSARALRLDTLTYYLDMAFVAAGCDEDNPRPKIDEPSFKTMFGLSGTADDAGEPRLLDLPTIRTATEGCLNWACDLDMSTLAYMLRLALLAASRASTDRE